MNQPKSGTPIHQNVSEENIAPLRGHELIETSMIDHIDVKSTEGAIDDLFELSRREFEKAYLPY